MKGKSKIIIATVLSVVLICGNTLTGFADNQKIEVHEENIASGVVDEDYGQITWVIDSEGKLTVTGTGDFTEQKGRGRTPWRDYAEEIKLAEIDVTGMTDASYLLEGCYLLNSVDMSEFDTSKVTNMEGMFESCSSLEELDVSNFDTSKVTNMGNMFSTCEELKNLDISSFDTSNVTDMNSMFLFCELLETLDLSSFNTSKVKDMSGMFARSGFKTLDLSSFDTSNVTNMMSMFEECTLLENIDLSSFDTSNVTNMGAMFWQCGSLKTLDLSNFNMLNVLDTILMVDNCVMLEKIKAPINCLQFVGLPIAVDSDNWYLADGTVVTALPLDMNTSVVITKNEIPNPTEPVVPIPTPTPVPVEMPEKTENVVDCGIYETENGQTAWILTKDGELILQGNDYPFFINGAPWKRYQHQIVSLDLHVRKLTASQFVHYELPMIKNIKISVDDTSDFTDLSNYFYKLESLENVYFEKFDTSHVTTMWGMFRECASLKNVNFSALNTSNVTDMSELFTECRSIESVDLSEWDTGNVTNMWSMFWRCENLREINLANLNTSKVTDMSYMFGMRSSVLEKIDLSSFDTSNVTNMAYMFAGCSAAVDIDVTSFDTRNVTNMGYMFRGCQSLKALDLSKFDLSAVNSDNGIHNFFAGCLNLEKIETPLNCSGIVNLPKENSNDVWFLDDGSVIEILPQDADHSVTVTKMKEENSLVTEVFSDVKDVWYTEYVQYVYDQGLMEGSNGLFNPGKNVTRAQLVTILYRLAGEPEVTDYSACDKLSDISKGKYYTDAVCWAYNEGITTGKNGIFDTTGNLTRQQMAAFLFRYANTMGHPTDARADYSSMLNADKVSSYSDAAISWAVGSELISGSKKTDANGNTAYDLDPLGNTSRAQMAAILTRFCDGYNL